jgi:hypothetical protein
MTDEPKERSFTDDQIEELGRFFVGTLADRNEGSFHYQVGAAFLVVFAQVHSDMYELEPIPTEEETTE